MMCPYLWHGGIFLRPWDYVRLEVPPLLVYHSLYCLLLSTCHHSNTTLDSSLPWRFSPWGLKNEHLGVISLFPGGTQRRLGNLEGLLDNPLKVQVSPCLTLPSHPWVRLREIRQSCQTCLTNFENVWWGAPGSSDKISSKVIIFTSHFQCKMTDENPKCLMKNTSFVRQNEQRGAKSFREPWWIQRKCMVHR